MNDKNLFYSKNQVEEGVSLFNKVFRFDSNKGENGSMYHYTSTFVLDKILESGCMRAVNLKYLNDSLEYEVGKNSFDWFNYVSALPSIQNILINHYGYYGFEVANKFFEIINHRIYKYTNYNPGIFSVSFTKQYDNLFHWVTYSKESGVSIEFDYDFLLHKENETAAIIRFVDDSGDKRIESNDRILVKTYHILRDVIYSNDDFIQSEDNDNKRKANSSSNKSPVDANTLLKELSIDANKADFLEKVDGGYAFSDKLLSKWCVFFQTIVSYYKDPSFVDEEEVRMVFMPCRNDKGHSTPIYYQSHKNVLRPYLEVEFLEKKKRSLPIKGILIGPSQHQQQVFDSVVHRLKYGKCCVHNYFEDNERAAKIVNNYIQIFNNYINDKKKVLKEFGVNIDIPSEKNHLCDYFESTTKQKFDLEPMKPVNIFDNVSTVVKYKQIISLFKKDYYLSKYGILVTKSKSSFSF